ncbi:hypothetical protein [Streptomyces sp. SCL15-4]|uniref:hypothetical protein n=1 Tax=Streptomyces sp. SCL15-4 TaxID=2967221 RepID=UPI002967761E|nr:hypothetical protein [Streptomyces sp. SCL15-4]
MPHDPQPLDLDAIETRANAATPGPWEEHPQYGPHFYAYLGGPYLRGVGTLNFGDGEDAEADREFVKHAREDIDAMAAEIRRLRAELARRVQCNDCGAVGEIFTATDGLAYLEPSGQIGHQRAARP